MKLKMLILGSLLLASAMTLAAQESPCLSADDVKAFRQCLADREFYKQRAENAEAINTALTASRDSWKALYEAEKVRADTVQGGRIDALQAALDTAKAQMADDRQKIGEQNAEIIKLKSGRKWWFGAGVIAGGAAGYLIGNKAGQSGGIVNVIAGSQPQFGARFSF